MENLKGKSVIAVVILLFGCYGEENGYQNPFPDALNGAEFLSGDSHAGLGSVSSALQASCEPPTSKIVINEIMADPKMVSDVYGEWIELYNPTAFPVSLSQYALEDKNGFSFVFPDIAIPSGGYLTVCRNSNVLLNGGVVCGAQWSGRVALSNTEGFLKLKDGNGTVVDEAAWLQQAVSGKSWALKNPHLDNSVAGNGYWTLSQASYGAGDLGTPGVKNSDVFSAVEDQVCDDGNPCTFNSCEIGICKSTWKDGCCLYDSQCDDQKPCTKDVCDLSTNKCSNALSANCCTKDSECVDENPCNLDVCLNNTCRHTYYNTIQGCCWAKPGSLNAQKIADAMCDDQVPCTIDKCDLNTSKCVVSGSLSGCCNTGADCDDNNFCTVDYCLNTKCVYVEKPGCCTQSSQCADSDPCTHDVCLMNLCRNFPKTDSGCCYEDKHCVTDPYAKNVCYAEKCVDKQCVTVTKSPCLVTLPYQENFDNAADLTSKGWTLADYGSHAQSNWSLAAHPCGSGKIVKFGWSPTVLNVKSILASPVIDTSDAKIGCGTGDNKQCKITVQWDQTYKHSGGSVRLSVVGTTNGDFLNGIELWSATPASDTDFEIKSVVLPAGITGSPTLQIGFFIETDSTFNLDSWTIDRFKIKASLPPEIPSGLQNFVAGVNDEVKKTVKVIDVDHATVPYVQTPMITFLGCPSDPVPFATVDKDTFYNSQGEFFKIITFDPDGNENLAGIYRATLLVSEGGGGSETENVRLESVYPMTITILLHHGYIVWSPLGKDHQGAAAVKSALAENGRASQILEDLSVYEDLNALDGIFAVLGVFGNKHQLTSSEGETLKADLDNGGRLYLEGGDVWFADPKTAVHDYFQIEAVSDGTVKTSENMKGYNFLYGYDYGYSLSGIVNAFIDNIKAKSGTGSRLILRNEGVRKTGSVVAYQGVGYRTIGSSVVFAGIEAKDGGQTKKALMGKYIYFLENGFPPCGSGAQCEDFDVCTADVCSDAICGNDQILGCVPCDDDSACGVAQACNPSLGYCVDVPGEIFASTDVPKSFGSMAPIVQSHYTVTSFGNINKIYLKAGIVHTYRGDVEIKLSHAGKTVVLKKNSLFDSGDDIYETYDVIQPGESLEQFKNTNIAGKWTLTVEDKDPLLNNGILKNWTLFADYDESTCAHLECDGDGVCSQKVNPGWCFIAETCHTEGTGDPSNQCRVCDTGVSQTSWSPRSNGTSCDDGMWCTVNDLCDNGVCSGLTKDCSDGISCTADACDEIQDECESSLSEGWCYISNGCYADNAANPSNQCQICDSQASFSSWTNKSDGSACNDGVQCTSNDICVSGSCGGVSYQCQPATCEETSECDGSGGCVVTYKPGGTICDDGNPCTYNDVCGSSGSSTLSASADSWIWQAAPGTNYGADTQMLVYPWTGASAMRRSLLKFDFSSIPSGSSVNSAVITLCEAGTYGFTRTIGFYRALKNWTEGGVTWNKSDGSGSWTATGGDFAATPTATASVSWTGVLDCDTWDVTADIQAFVAGSLPNYGWVIKDANEDNSQNWWSFATKENASASQRPKLTVSYTKGGGCSGVSYSCVPTACQETSECDGSGGCDVVYKAQGTNCGSNMECDGGGNCVELTKILYVNSVSGNNMTAQIGNPLKPWKTVQGAINSVPSVLDAAYIVEITNSATYNETVTITAKTTTAKNTLTVRAQSGQSPLIVGQNTYSAAVTLQTVNYVTLKGLRTKGGDRRNAIRLIDGSNYNTIEGCEAFGTTNQGYSAIDIKKSANNIVTGCSIYGSQNGISVYDYGAADNVIKNNLIYNNTYRGVWIYRVTYGNVVANNTIYNNATGIHLGHGNNNYDPGINNIFVNNIIYAGIASSYAIKVNRYGNPKLMPAGSYFNYNDIYAPGSGAKASHLDGVDYATLADWKTATKQDEDSFSGIRSL